MVQDLWNRVDPLLLVQAGDQIPRQSIGLTFRQGKADALVAGEDVQVRGHGLF